MLLNPALNNTNKIWIFWLILYLQTRVLYLHSGRMTNYGGKWHRRNYLSTMRSLIVIYVYNKGNYYGMINYGSGRSMNGVLCESGPEYIPSITPETDQVTTEAISKSMTTISTEPTTESMTSMANYSATTANVNNNCTGPIFKLARSSLKIF